MAASVPKSIFTLAVAPFVYQPFKDWRALGELIGFHKDAVYNLTGFFGLALVDDCFESIPR